MSIRPSSTSYTFSSRKVTCSSPRASSRPPVSSSCMTRGSTARGARPPPTAPPTSSVARTILARRLRVLPGGSVASCAPVGLCKRARGGVQGEQFFHRLPSIRSVGWSTSASGATATRNRLNVETADRWTSASLCDLAARCSGRPRVRRRAVALSTAATPQRRLCLLYTSPSPRDATLSRMPSSA